MRSAKFTRILSEMPAKLPRGWKLPFLCILLVTSAGTHVNEEDSGPTTGTPPDDQNTTLPCLLLPKTRRLTLARGDYEILSDERLLVSGSNLTVNSSFYLVGGDRSAVVCLPQGERSSFVAPLYFASMALFFHAQVPLYIWGVRSLNSWSFMGCAVFVYAVVLSYVDAPDCDQPECPSDAFAAFWYGLPPYLSVSAVHVSGALTFLYSESALTSQVEARRLFSKKGTASFKDTAFSGVAFLSTYALILSGAYDLSNSMERDFPSLNNFMPYFLPSCISYFIVFLVFCHFEAKEPPKVICANDRRLFRDRYETFCVFFLTSYVNYGFAALMIGSVSLWDPIFEFSILYPIVLCYFRFKISRRVSCTSSSKCVKVPVKDGEVQTVSSEKLKKNDKRPVERGIDLVPTAPTQLQSPPDQLQHRPAVLQTLPVQIQNLPV